MDFAAGWGAGVRPIWVAGILREGFNGVVLIDSDIGIGEEIFKFGV